MAARDSSGRFVSGGASSLSAGKAASVTIEGLDRIQRILDDLSAQSPRISATAARAGMSLITKSIRAQIPSKYRHLRGVVKHTVKRGRGGRGTTAKSGLGVGKRKIPKRRHAHKGGVGLSSQNIHWATLGTGSRTTGSGAYRGVMPPILGGVVERGFAAVSSAATQAIVTRGEVELEKALAKAARRRT